MDVKALLGRNVRRRRQALGWSQEELAHRAGNMKREYLTEIELGQRNPSITVVARIAAALEMEIADLLRSE